MTWYAEVGDKFERSVLVINDNDIPVNINVTASGDLADDIKIIDKTFTLQPGEQKKARFTLEIKSAGTTTNRINVAFQAINKTGGGMSSVITINAYEKGKLLDEKKSALTDGGDYSDSSDANADNTGGSTMLTGNIIKSTKGAAIALGVMTLILFIVLIGLLSAISSKKKKGVKK